MEARHEALPVSLSGAKVHTVLAALVLARARVVSDTSLSTLLWDWAPPSTSGAQLYTYVSRIRAALGSAADVVREARGYSLRPAAGTHIDAVEFERLTRQGADEISSGAPGRAATTLRAALGLWRGPALSNTTEYLITTEAAQLEERRAIALESRIEADLALGRHRALVPELTGLVARQPLRERLRVQLMTALCRADRQADAIGTYHEGRRVLAEELGVDPGPALTDAYQAALHGGLTALSGGPRSARSGRCPRTGRLRGMPLGAQRYRR
ncbi:AfsR/SARP family transcriptional regulator [Streptomyces sp. NBC_00400]|uniref:AfsR/SARP family transcriptional regulator n=1 Tax=Streptomyces sp. NBC_00400 TaxID=2975737 RepID=UPI002E2440F8